MTQINKFTKQDITEPRQLAGIKRGQAKNPVWMISPKNPNVEYTTEGLKLFTQQISNAMKGKYGANAGMIGTAVKYEHESWRGGYMQAFGDNVRMHSFRDSDNCNINDGDDKIVSFHLYYVNNGNPRGGGDDNDLNDCLYDCLKEVLGDKLQITAEQLKQKLFLTRDAKINMSKLPAVEKLIHYKINLTGDYNKLSKFNAKQEINIVLKKGHFTLQPIKRIINQHIISGEPLVYEKDGTNFKCFNGAKYLSVDKEKFYEWKNNMTGYYILIEKYHKKTLEETYNYYLDSSIKLKEATNGKIDLSKTGEYTTTALKLFNELNTVSPPEPILIDEAEWINKATTGAIIFGDKYEGELFSYDFISFYPSILRSTQLLIPISRGTFNKITSDEFNNMKFIRYGIYRCSIEVEDHKLMRQNKFNYYTHIDITRARELQYNITLIEDDEPNVLYYSREKTINACQAFRPFVDYMYELKRNNIPGAKNILNCLWGALCESMNFIVYHKEGAETNIDQDKPLISIKPRWKNEEDYEIKLQSINKTFKSDWARLKPFLLSKGRTLLSKAIEPNVEHIMRSHTDSLYSSIKLNDLVNLGNNMGDIKYTGSCINAKIHHANLVNGIFN